MKRSYLFLAEGFEEIEALTPVDVMRRANLEIHTVAIGPDRAVKGAHGVTVMADMTFSEMRSLAGRADWLILPGGMPGASNLAAFTPLNDLLLAHAAEGGNIAAICAAPAVVLGPLGLLDGKAATCYPGFEKLAPNALWQEQRVVAIPHLVTANGPSSALPWALTILAADSGDTTAHEVGSGMLFYDKKTNFYF